MNIRKIELNLGFLMKRHGIVRQSSSIPAERFNFSLIYISVHQELMFGGEKF